MIGLGWLAGWLQRQKVARVMGRAAGGLRKRLNSEARSRELPSKVLRKWPHAGNVRKREQTGTSARDRAATEWPAKKRRPTSTRAKDKAFINHMGK